MIMKRVRNECEWMGKVWGEWAKWENVSGHRSLIFIRIQSKILKIHNHFLAGNFIKY